MELVMVFIRMAIVVIGINSCACLAFFIPLRRKRWIDAVSVSFKKVN